MNINTVITAVISRLLEDRYEFSVDYSPKSESVYINLNLDADQNKIRISQHCLSSYCNFTAMNIVVYDDVILFESNHDWSKIKETLAALGKVQDGFLTLEHESAEQEG